MTDHLPRQADVVIAGAGIGGLSAALALHDQGIDPLVFESSRELKPLGVGINLQPQAVQALTDLGLRERLDEIAVPDSGARYVTTSGVELAHTTFNSEHQQMAVHRGTLQMMLYRAVRDRLPEGSVVPGQQVVGFEQDTEGVDVEVVDRENDSRHTIRARVLLGADGVHSRIRLALHPEAGQNHWEGTTMYRGTRLTEQPFLDGHTMVLAYGEDAKRFLAYPIFHESGKTLINWVAMVPTSDEQMITDKQMKNVETAPGGCTAVLRGMGARVDGCPRHHQGIRRRPDVPYGGPRAARFVGDRPGYIAWRRGSSNVSHRCQWRIPGDPRRRGLRPFPVPGT